MKRLILGTAIFFLLFAAEAISDDSEEKSAFQKHEESFKVKPPLPEKKKIKFRGYSSFRRDFDEMCDYIEADGQIEWLRERAEINSTELKSCPICRSLYITLKGACKPKKARGKNVDGNAKEKRVARLDPSTELIDHVSRIFREMAEKPKENAEGFYIGIEFMLAEMRDANSKSVLAKNYYDTLSEYIDAPFKARGIGVEEKGSAANKAAATPTPSVSLDELF